MVRRLAADRIMADDGSGGLFVADISVIGFLTGVYRRLHA